MSQVKVGHFTGTGANLNLDIGFVPDYMMLIEFGTSTNIKIFHWFNRMEGDLASGLQEGISVLEGVTARLADAGGITAYNTASVQYMIPAPSGDAPYKGKTATLFALATDYSSGYTARDGTNVGDVVTPITPNGFCYELHTATGVGTSEPTWSTQPGVTCTDGGANVWICRPIRLERVGFEGVTIDADLSTDSVENFYMAVKADEDTDHGDAASF